MIEQVGELRLKGERGDKGTGKDILEVLLEEMVQCGLRIGCQISESRRLKAENGHICHALSMFFVCNSMFLGSRKLCFAQQRNA